MKRSALQTTLFPDAPRPVHKPEPGPAEADFMQELQRLAVNMDQPSIHIENYCGNSFYSVCSLCGHRDLVTCRHTINKHLAGYPDIIGISWGIETKRDGFEPSPLQVEVHKRLSRQGVPVMIASPGNLLEAVRFLQKLAKGA